MTSACSGGGGDTTTNPDVTAPSVVIFTPATNTTISANQAIVVVFDESMDPSSLVLEGTMASQSGLTTWTATTRANDTLSLLPSTTWTGGSGALTIDVTDSAGNSLPTLSLSYNVDDIPPTGNVSPANGATIGPSTEIVINFSESIDIGSLQLIGSLFPQSDGGVWSNNDATLTLTPNTTWVGGSATLTLDGTDTAGNSIPTLLLSYNVDDIPPTGNESPANGDTIGPDTGIVINFSESIDTGSLLLTGTLQSDGGVWSSVTNNNDTLTLKPGTSWTSGVGTIIVDAADLYGNPLSQLSLTYTIGTPVTATVTPNNGSKITNADQIVIIFTESIDTNTLNLKGSMASVSDGGTWSTTTFANDTLSIDTTTGWPLGTATNLSLTVSSLLGVPLTTLNLIYEVVPQTLYVRDSDGLDTNPGTAIQPYKTISAAIASATISPANIHVAEGNYTEHNLAMVEGVSLYGGYDGTDWNTCNTNLHPTIVTDPTMSGGTAEQPNTVFLVGNGITENTVIDGFTLNGGGGYSSAILIAGDSIEKNSSPVIQNNILNGGNGPAWTMAIVNTNSSMPLIQNNTIFGGTGASRSYGILSRYSLTPTIRNNVIHGGVATLTTRAIDNISDVNAALIQNNTLYSGDSPDDSKGILYGVNAAPAYIENNIIFGGTYCIYENATVDPGVLRNNNLSTCTTLYGDRDSQKDFDTICPGGNFGISGCSITLATPIGVDNSDEDAVAEFVDFDGLDDDIDTIADNDWHLMISSSDVLRTGARDLSPLFSFDLDGVTRTGDGSTGWSRGAYERD